MKAFQSVLFAAATVVSLLGTAVTSTAAVIYVNGPPDGIFAQTSDRGFIDGIEAADSFSLLAGKTTIRDVHWWGIYTPSNTPQAIDSFTITIYTDASGKPDSVVATPAVTNLTRTDTGANFGGSDIYAFSATVTDTSLTAGTTYWLSIVNDTIADTDDDWAWVGTSSDAHSVVRVAPDVTWQDNDNTGFAFNLTDDTTTDGQVPEPSTLLLLGGGLAGIAVWRRRRS